MRVMWVSILFKIDNIQLCGWYKSVCFWLENLKDTYGWYKSTVVGRIHRGGTLGMVGPGGDGGELGGGWRFVYVNICLNAIGDSSWGRDFPRCRNCQQIMVGCMQVDHLCAVDSQLGTRVPFLSRVKDFSNMFVKKWQYWILVLEGTEWKKSSWLPWWIFLYLGSSWLPPPSPTPGSLVEEALHFESAQNLGMGDFSVRNWQLSCFHFALWNLPLYCSHSAVCYCLQRRLQTLHCAHTAARTGYCQTPDITFSFSSIIPHR